MAHTRLSSIISFICLILHLYSAVVVVVESKPNVSNLKMLARWCCVNQNEFQKCIDWKNALNRSNQSNILLDCIPADDKFECFKLIFEDQADLMTADAGDVYTAGKYYNLVPISSELYGSQLPGVQPHSSYYSVAVIKRGSGLTMETLQGKNSCHGGVGTSSGWNVPISTLIEKKLLEIVDCNNHVKAATKFFNRMCAPDALNVQFNPTGDNPTSACDLCAGKIGSTFCTNQDPYAGHLGAMYCLNDGGGDVAFVKHTTVSELAARNRTINVNNYELLCSNRSDPNFPYATAPINEYMRCNWGQVPGRAVITSSRKARQQKNDYKAFIKLSASLFSGRPSDAAISALSTSTRQMNVYQNQNQFPSNQLQQQPQQQPYQAQSFYNQQPFGQYGQYGVSNNQFNQYGSQDTSQYGIGSSGGGAGSSQYGVGGNQYGSGNIQYGGSVGSGYNQYGYGSNTGYNQQQQQQQQQGAYNWGGSNVVGNSPWWNGRKRRQSFNFFNQQNQTAQQQQLQESDRYYMFSSLLYGGRDLLFIDDTVSFEDLDDELTYLSFLNSRSPDYLNKILKLYECPLRLVRWCVISNYEKDKCRLMKNAFASRNIKPDLDCVSAKNALECMSMVKNRLADLITVDPADAYRANRYYGLYPLAAEDYGTNTEKPIYYTVAVVKKTDLTTNLWNLRAKRMCGTAIGDMAGWHIPVDYLIGIKELYVTDCHVSKVVGEYFGRSCVPGAQDYDYNKLRTNPRALCLACYSKGADYCARSHKELYYGDTGAFRCLNEGRGDVAFVRHTSVKPNTDGRNTDQWARPLRQTDFELLCKDGTRKSIEKFEECHLVAVPSRVVMVAGHRTDIQRSYLWNMLNFAQQLFGSDTNEEFTMFESMKEHPDLIFHDAAVQLIEIQDTIEDYLGSDLIALLHRTDDRICNSALKTKTTTISGLVVLFICLFLFQ